MERRIRTLKVPVNNVSFGAVIAVFGNKEKVKEIHQGLSPHASRGEIMIKDVTRHYRNSSTGGLMEKTAKSGDSVELYITRKDIQKVIDRNRGWDTLDGILSNLGTYFQVDKRTSANDTARKILNC